MRFHVICALGLCLLDASCGVAIISGPTCSDGQRNGTETDADCGGACSPCSAGRACLSFSDCESGNCEADVCKPSATCTDQVQNGQETDVDCGGTCPPCATGKRCLVAADCQSGRCQGGVCQAIPSCANGAQDGDESDVDCGGSCTACVNGKHCRGPQDCRGGACRNQVCETAVGNCSDSAKNGDESDVDCGGSCCPCAADKACLVGQDCISRVCKAEKCQAATCSDGVKNGLECGRDCGGPCPTACATEVILRDVFDGANICPNGQCARDVQGGSMASGSWSPQAKGNRLVYDFGRHVDCGRAIVEVTDFRPHDQFQPRDNREPYTEFIALFDGLEDDPNDRFNHYSDYSQIDLIYPPSCFDCNTDPGAPNCECCVADLANCPTHCQQNDLCASPNFTHIKANSGLLTACDWESANYTSALSSSQTHYVFELDWSPQVLILRVDGQDKTRYDYPMYPKPSCAFTCRPKTPQLEWLFINQPMFDGGGHLVGPKYVRVQVEAALDHP